MRGFEAQIGFKAIAVSAIGVAGVRNVSGPVELLHLLVAPILIINRGVELQPVLKKAVLAADLVA